MYSTQLDTYIYVSSCVLYTIVSTLYLSSFLITSVCSCYISHFNILSLFSSVFCIQNILLLISFTIASSSSFVSGNYQFLTVLYNLANILHMRGLDDFQAAMTFIAIRKTTSNAQKIKSITVSMPSCQLRLHDPA